MFVNRHVTLTTEAAPDYSAGDLCGGMLSFQQRSPEGGGRLSRFVMKSQEAIGIASKLYLFDQELSADTPFTENGAFAIAAADRSKLIEVIDIAALDWVDYTTRAGLYIVKKALDVPFILQGSGNRFIYGAWVVEAGLNLAYTDKIEAMLGSEVD